jgi:hypothetical protein
MHTKHLLAAAAAAVAAFGAQAATIGLGNVVAGDVKNFSNTVIATNVEPGVWFDDSVTFTLSSTTAVVGGLISNSYFDFALDPGYGYGKISGFTVSLTGGTFATSVTTQGPFDVAPNQYNLVTQTKTLNPLVLAAGTYTLHVSGTPDPYTNSTYTGVLSFTTAPPVPEPETYALLLAGLGALGFLARRRNA